MRNPRSAGLLVVGCRCRRQGCSKVPEEKAKEIKEWNLVPNSHFSGFESQPKWWMTCSPFIYEILWYTWYMVKRAPSIYRAGKANGCRDDNTSTGGPIVSEGHEDRRIVG